MSKGSQNVFALLIGTIHLSTTNLSTTELIN